MKLSMKVTLIAFLSVAIYFMLTTTIHAKKSDEKGEWSDWWSLGKYIAIGGSVKRIYDHENRLVCWVYVDSNSGGISCVPSLELDHPSTR